jgi:hypothetical protein
MGTATRMNKIRPESDDDVFLRHVWVGACHLQRPCVSCEQAFITYVENVLSGFEGVIKIEKTIVTSHGPCDHATLTIEDLYRDVVERRFAFVELSHNTSGNARYNQTFVNADTLATRAGAEQHLQENSYGQEREESHECLPKQKRANV